MLPYKLHIVVELTPRPSLKYYLNFSDALTEHKVKMSQAMCSMINSYSNYPDCIVTVYSFTKALMFSTVVLPSASKESCRGPL